MIRKSTDMQAQAIDKIMSSAIQPQAISEPMRPGVGERLNVYA